jgi:two-component system, chemotaxis family, CheB/CheR fusion protein
VEAEEHQRLLVQELNHRVRNMLTVVIALAKQTLSCNEPPERTTRALIGRIQAMANSYNLISRQNWHDVSLADIVEVELGPYSNGPERVTISGPPVKCVPSTAVSLTLVVHELATNALKYGGLSGPDGGVAVTWTIGEDGKTLVIDWRECTKEPIEKPSHKGLGSKLIERQMKAFPGATMEHDYHAHGLHVRFTIPLGELIFAGSDDGS